MRRGIWIEYCPSESEVGEEVFFDLLHTIKQTFPHYFKIEYWEENDD